MGLRSALLLWSGTYPALLLCSPNVSFLMFVVVVVVVFKAPYQPQDPLTLFKNKFYYFLTQLWGM